MGIFSEISKIEKLRDARMEAGRSGEAQPGGVKPWVRGGFWLICGLAACSLVLLRLFSNGSMPPNWAFSVGVESFSHVKKDISAVITNKMRVRFNSTIKVFLTVYNSD